MTDNTELVIRTSGDGGSRLVTLSGASDLATAPALREALQLLCPPDVMLVVVDVAQLEYLDSTGLGIIFGALRRLREGGGELRIAGATGAVQRVFEVTGLSDIVPQYEHSEDALR